MGPHLAWDEAILVEQSWEMKLTHLGTTSTIRIVARALGNALVHKTRIKQFFYIIKN